MIICALVKDELIVIVKCYRKNCPKTWSQ